MVDGDDDGMDKSILPGLPDDLALRCLAKISHGYHGVLECVSKSWRDAIRSTYYAHLKASEGWCGNWLFVSTSEQNIDMWDAYDPDADKWHTLPRMPRFRNDVSRSRFSVVSLHKKLLVIGGCYVTSNSPLATNEVIIFDPFKKQWSRLANMRTPRADFACTVICGLVYVAGGCNSCDTGLSAAEVYDPITDRWEDLPPMPLPLFECFSVSHGGQFHVVGKKGFNVESDTYIIYDPVGKKWRTVDDELVLFSKLSRFTVTTMNDRIYAIPDGSVRTMETTRMDWSLLGVLPSVVPPLHTRPLKPFCFGFAGFEQYLYVAGGLTLKFDSNASAYSIMKLNCCRRCNPAKSPLRWQDVKPMPRQSGGVLGCCAIQE